MTTWAVMAAESAGWLVVFSPSQRKVKPPQQEGHIYLSPVCFTVECFSFISVFPVFSLFKIVSWWIYYTHSTFLNFLLCVCVCVHVEDVVFYFPLVTGYFLLLPLCSSSAHTGEQKRNYIWGTYPLCYAWKHEGYFIRIFPFNFHLLTQQWIHLWLLKPGLLGLNWQFTEADCQGKGKSPFLSAIFIGLTSVTTTPCNATGWGQSG